MDNINVVEIPSLFQNKITKRITIADGGVTIEKTLSFDPPVFIPVDEIADFRYSIQWITGYAFNIGRVYFIEIRDIHKNVVKISLKSIYRIRRSAYDKAWCELVSKLWSSYFVKIARQKLNSYKKQEIFELAGIKFLFDGIRWNAERILFWQDIALSNYRTYFMIYDVNDVQFRKSFDFGKDWNAKILQEVLKLVIKNPREN